VLGCSDDPGLRGAAGRLFEAAVPATLTFSSPRAWAFSVLGMQAYLDWFPGDRVIQGARNLLAICKLWSPGGAASRRRGYLRPDWVYGILLTKWGEGTLRPAARRGLCDCLGLSPRSRSDR
jgi:hypothetical protein